MKQDQVTHGEDKSVVSTRVMDVTMALFFAAIGGLVVFDSVRLGNGWGDSGPEAGYFPFYIGLILIAAGLGIAAQALFGAEKAKGDSSFVSRSQLKSVAMVFLPTLAFVVFMQFVGLYVAAALFIMGFMVVNGKYPVVKTIPYAIIVPTLIFTMFEIWFLVPLPKGPIEAMLGF